MTAGGLSRRYAKALADVAAERGVLEPVGRDLRAMAGLLKEHREAAAFFANPAIPLTDKRRVLLSLTERVGVSPLSASFLSLILEKRRLPHLEEMAFAYEELIDERLNRVKATVTSAIPLPDQVLEQLKTRLGAVTGKEVYQQSRLDPTILGGLVAQVGGTIYDGSVRTQLRRLREQLLKG
ncbi:MAG: ATP synthase F1 subunit delta [Candidatus Methylomirabilaceae bacterium]